MYQTTVKYSEIKNTRKIRKPKLLHFGIVFLIIAILTSTLAYIFTASSRKDTSVMSLVTQNINHVFNKGSDAISAVWSPELASKDGYTSLLVIGPDSRKVEYNGNEFIPLVSKVDGDRNTDTIMQIVYDHKSGNVFMISIPRDMGVDVNMSCLELHDRINSVYDHAQNAGCEGGGVEVLSQVVENITGIKVNYYVMITLKAFEDIISTIGEENEQGEKGIYVDVDKALYEAYPNDQNGYDPVYFPAGRQFLTPHRALQYARSRAQTSDFDRARRQQKVIQAVKHRVLSTETFTNPGKVYSLINAFKNNVKYSDLSVNETRAAISLVSSINDSQIYNIVLDPKFGGHNVLIKKYVSRPGLYFYMSAINWRECGEEDAFCLVRDQVQRIIKDPSLIS